MLGRQIGRFRIVAKLGEGGMGSVWKAEDTFAGRVVAIKFLSAGTAATTSTRHRFMRGARATSALVHPGVPTLYEAGEHEGQLYVAVAFVDGETVADRIASGPLPLEEARRIAVEAARILEHAHLKGVFHRDISSRNVMCSHDGRVSVIDFGLASLRGATDLTSSGTTLGTLAYMAPEVLGGQKAGRRADIYSLGVVMYEMATGRLPYVAEQVASLFYAILHTRPQPPSALRAEIGPQLERAILKALARDPSRRHHSAAEMAEALSSVRLPEPERRPPRVRTARARRAVTDLPDPKLLAIFPFQHLAAEDAAPGSQALSRGIAEALSAALSRAPRLQVLPPSQWSSADLEADPRGLARRSGANLMLTGQLRQAGDQIRVSYTLLDVRNGTQWAADQLDAPARELLTLEDRLRAGILRGLRIHTVPGTQPAPTDPEAHERYLRALGHLLRRESEADVDKAIELLEGLIASEGDTAMAHSTLAKAYVRKHKLSYQREWRDKAEASCRTALSLDPHSPDVLVTLGRLHLESGRLDDAVEVLRRSLALQAENPEALLYLLRVCGDRGDFAQAERSGQLAIELRPDYWYGHDCLALLYFRWGRFDLAAKGYRKVIELVPDHHNAYSNLAASQFHLGEFEDSIATYERCLEIHPQASAYSGLGTVLFFSGQRDRALEMFEQAVRLRPRDARVWGNLADAQRWSGTHQARSTESFDRAIALAREQLAANPTDPDGWSQLAKWLAKRGWLAEAVEALERAFSLAPENLGGIARAVAVHHLAGDRAAALRCLRKAVEGGYSLLELGRDPELEGLRLDPEAQRILRDGETKRTRTQAA